MAAKGTLAKENLIKKFASALPEGTYIGEFDKKYYFWSEENGERVQVALSLTCPKNQVEQVVLKPTGGGISFEDTPQYAPKVHEPAEMSEDELDRIQELMAKLGL